jgi:dephospho-CoA kinase
MFTVALTGEIGAGKSTMARIWRDLGANVFDADTIAKEQWRSPEIIKKIKIRWGDDVIQDGVPDYGKIAEFAFSNDEEYQFTISLIHPATISKMAKTVHALSGWVVLEIPLLFESGWFDLIDCVICVTATDDLRISRNLDRGWGETELSRRERFLIGSQKKQSLSDLVLCNIGNMESWESRALELGELMRRMSSVYEIDTCCGQKTDAERIAKSLVENRLAARVSITEIRNIYRGEDKIQDSAEWNLRCLTTESALRRARENIRQNHSHVYETPAIIATEVRHSDFQTLRWVVENCS